MKSGFIEVDGKNIDVWMDDSGNAWYKDVFYEKLAEEKAKTLKGFCTGCVNCENLEDCVNCKSCSRCVGCKECEYCHGCSYSEKCYECENCVSCDNCRYCGGCSNCSKMLFCYNCVKCEDGLNLSACKGCVGCCLVSGYEHNPFHVKQHVVVEEYKLGRGTSQELEKKERDLTVHFHYYDGKIALVVQEQCIFSDEFKEFRKKLDYYSNDKKLREKLEQQVDIFWGMYQILKMMEKNSD